MSYVWQNKTWLFEGIGVAVVLGAISGAGRLWSLWRKPRSSAPPERVTNGGHRFEFADGVIAYAKLRGSWELVDIFTLLSKAKDQDDFARKIAPLIHARAAYRLEKFTYSVAKDRRREIELELVRELAPDFAAYGTRLKNITIGALVRKTPAQKDEPSKSIPLGTQTRTLKIEIRKMAEGGTSAVELRMVYKVTNPYKFLYSAVDGPYAYIQPVIESEVRFEIASASVRSVISDRQAIEERLLAKLTATFTFVGLTLDSIKILGAE